MQCAISTTRLDITQRTKSQLIFVVDIIVVFIVLQFNKETINVCYAVFFIRFNVSYGHKKNLIFISTDQ